MSLRLNQASKPQHRALRLPRRRRPRRSRIPAPRELRRRRRRLCARFQSLPQRATRHPASRPLTASPRIKIRNQLWSAPRKHGVYGLANKPAQRPAGNKKKKWVAACHPFLFGRPVRPPRARRKPLSSAWAQYSALAYHWAYVLRKARRPDARRFRLMVGNSSPPAHPPIGCPTQQKAYFSATFSSTGKRITRLSFIQAVVFWLQPDTRRADDYRASPWPRPRKRAAPSEAAP